MSIEDVKFEVSRLNKASSINFVNSPHLFSTQFLFQYDILHIVPNTYFAAVFWTFASTALRAASFIQIDANLEQNVKEQTTKWWRSSGLRRQWSSMAWMDMLWFRRPETGVSDFIMIGKLEIS